MPGQHRAHRPSRIPGIIAAIGVAAGSAWLITATAPSARADISWGAIISCESGGNPTAQNPASTASGLFQFLDTSWAAYGGTQYASRAKDATPAQQYAVANTAYAQSGLTPWAASQSCWGGKVTTLAQSLKATAAPVAQKAAPSRRRGAPLALASIPRPKPAANMTPITAGATNSAGARAVSAALSYQGTPYAYGGNTPGVALDCSALVQQAYRAAGVPTLPRVAKEQAQAGQSVPYSLTALERGDYSALKPGDILAYYAPVSHVALYAGNGRVVEASTEGVPVHVRSLYTDDLMTIRRVAT